MAWLDGWRSPVLVIHGDDDRNVSFSETVDLVEALRERNVEVEQLILPGRDPLVPALRELAVGLQGGLRVLRPQAGPPGAVAGGVARGEDPPGRRVVG